LVGEQEFRLPTAHSQPRPSETVWLLLVARFLIFVTAAPDEISHNHVTENYPASAASSAFSLVRFHTRQKPPSCCSINAECAPFQNLGRSSFTNRYALPLLLILFHATPSSSSLSPSCVSLATTKSGSPSLLDRHRTVMTRPQRSRLKMRPCNCRPLCQISQSSWVARPAVRCPCTCSGVKDKPLRSAKKGCFGSRSQRNHEARKLWFSNVRSRISPWRLSGQFLTIVRRPQTGRGDTEVMFVKTVLPSGAVQGKVRFARTSIRPRR
jgi:hypothetical protein